MEAPALKIGNFALGQSIAKFEQESGFSHAGVAHDSHDLT
jgi:hypothetical protein